jgi:hypothetical protein
LLYFSDGGCLADHIVTKVVGVFVRFFVRPSTTGIVYLDNAKTGDRASIRKTI